MEVALPLSSAGMAGYGEPVPASKPPLRRIGVLGDVHCENAALKTALRHFERERVEAVFAVGDLVDGPGDANETIALLQAAKVVAVSGNHERWVLANEMRTLPDATPRAELRAASVAYLRALPRTREFETVAGLGLLCHGVGDNDFVGVRPADADEVARALPELVQLENEGRIAFVVNGHTHRPMLRRIGRITLLNVGTLLSGHRPVCSVLDFEARRMTLFDVATSSVTLAAEWSFDARSALDTGR
jgi:predicted phosphodiesterase